MYIYIIYIYIYIYKEIGIYIKKLVLEVLIANLPLSLRKDIWLFVCMEKPLCQLSMIK